MIYHNQTFFLEKPITFTAVPHGKDFAVSIMGGDQFHIGAVAVCLPGATASVFPVSGHKEGPMASSLAEGISLSLSCVVSVSAGIHYDEITKPQLNELLQLVEGLKDAFIRDVNVL